MATSVRLIRRYVWLIDTIRRAGKITLEDINRKWMAEQSIRHEDESEIPDRTFHRHREAIADIFGVDILCDRSAGNTYYLANPDELNHSGFSSWLFNGLAIYNRLMADRSISSRIYFEENPGGSEYITAITEALVKKQLLNIGYRSFNSGELKRFEVEPYGLKQSARRWYMIAHIPDYETLTLFALDRIETFNITEEKFEYDKNWNLDSYFDEVIGVNLEEDYDCENVKIRVYGHQRHYIESLPLHKSQKQERREKEYSEYSFRLRPEYEFQHEILKMGYNAEVLSPQWLRDEIKWQAEEILKLYSKDS